MVDRSSKRREPPDVAQLAKSIVDELTAEEGDQDTKPEKNPAAVALGKLGGQKGGPARAAKLSKKKRSDIAKKAAQARWNKPQGETKGKR
jgi:hypothetical protein